jgi:hypothetical protein
MKGLIFIPDISGFTNFVKKTDIDLGRKITRELLIEIIESNPLYMDISELEGDAVLYFKEGKPIEIETLLSGFQEIMKRFNKKYQQLRDLYKIEAELSLKLIVHYGSISTFQLKGFTKLYGRTVIEAHRLLKNGSKNSNYILITDDYFKALNKDVNDINIPDWAHSEHERRVYEDVGILSFYYFHYLSLHSAQPFYHFARGIKLM